MSSPRRVIISNYTCKYRIPLSFICIAWFTFVHSFNFAGNINLHKYSKRAVNDAERCSDNQFSCAYGGCVAREQVCNGVVDCVDESDETPELCKNTTCSSNQFRCNYGGCLQLEQVCNGIKDCIDNTDESATLCQNTKCSDNQFRCNYGGCLALERLCDGFDDCIDDSDETKLICENKTCTSDQFRCNYGGCLARSKVCNGRVDCIDWSDETSDLCENIKCTGNQFRCNYGGCLAGDRLCNGIRDCFDNSDETMDLCQNLTCPKEKFLCEYGGCLSTIKVCDGVTECVDFSDEAEDVCQNRICTDNQFRCKYGGCLSRERLCNGVRDCVDNSDEGEDLCRNTTCASNQFRCNYGGCLGGELACDGSEDCLDSSDETEDLCQNTTCPSNFFRCNYGGCLQTGWVCNGVADCIDRSDETPDLCENRTCLDTQLRCNYGGCLPKELKCNGVRDCIDGSDESEDLCQNETCASSEFRCNYGGCLDRELLCNGNVDCFDNSDEEQEICQNSTESGLSVGCIIPPHSQGRNYTIHCDQSQQHCPSEPGGTVTELTEIIIRCNAGYALENEDTFQSVCADGVWLPLLENCKRTCKPIQATNEEITCYQSSKKDLQISCDRTFLEGTVINIRCKPQYRLETPVYYNEITCGSDGEWSNMPFKCVPICGMPSLNATMTTADGQKIRYGNSPWHVGIYDKSRSKKPILICGGTIISPHLVVSAAQCFYSQRYQMENNPSDFVVVIGKVYDNYAIRDSNETKTFNVQQIYYPEDGFTGHKTSYVGDIVVVHLDQKINYTAAVLPACVHFNDCGHFNPEKNITGTLSGWGLCGKRGHANTGHILRTVDIPYISRKECLNFVNKHFNCWIALFDKFCAGKSIAGVKQGDSGGGLLFREPDSNLFYLQGVQSIKGWSSGMSVSTFTDVSMYAKWISGIVEKVENAQT